MWDVNTKKAAFTAKNVPVDKLRMRVPVWVTSIGWFSGEPNRLVVGTGYGHVCVPRCSFRCDGEKTNEFFLCGVQLRLYDTRANTQPIFSKVVSEIRVTSVLPSKDDKLVYFGDGYGETVVWDIRAARVQGKLRVRSRFILPSSLLSV